MIDSYDALTLGVYMRVNEVIESEADDLDKQVRIIAILSGKTVDEVLLLPIADYAQMAAKTAFLREHCKPTEIKEDWQYEDLVPVTDFRQINVAQYIDFQTFSKSFPKSMPELLSVFLVPQGCVYNEQYDVAAVVERVKQLPFADALGLSAFFFGRLAQSIEDSLTSWASAMRRTRNKRKRMQMQREMMKRIEEVEALLRSAGAGLQM